MAKIRHIPERSCVACGEKMPKAQLVRVVRSAQGSVTVDVTGRASGKGAYLCHSPECWNRAVAKGSLGRSFGQDFSPHDLEQIQAYFQDHIAAQPREH